MCNFPPSSGDFDDVILDEPFDPETEGKPENVIAIVAAGVAFAAFCVAAYFVF